MSQCTFTNGISVAAVAVVEVQPLVEDSILEMDVRDESLIHYIILYVALFLIQLYRTYIDTSNILYYLLILRRFPALMHTIPLYNMSTSPLMGHERGCILLG